MAHSIHLHPAPAAKAGRLRCLLWAALLSCLLTAAGLRSLQAFWDAPVPPLLPAALAAAGAWAFCALADRTAQPLPAWALRLLPWLLLAPFAADLWRGLLLWLNGAISLWNRAHQGGAALFAVSAADRSTQLFSLAAGAALGQLTHWFTVRRRTVFCAALTFLSLLLSLLTDTLSPLSCCLWSAGLLGLWLTPRDKAPARQAIRLWGVCTAFLLLGTALLPQREITGVTRLRQGAVQGVHTMRYGKDCLPAGHMDRAALLARGDTERLTVRTEQEKDLYLRAFVGAAYSDGVWTPLSDEAYGGDYAGMLDWLTRQGFDPLTQPAAYYRLTDEEDAPQQNRLIVAVSGASRDYLYLPASVSEIKGIRTTDRKDTRLAPVGLRGADFYTAEELSSARPSELTVRAAWVSHPETEEQQRYAAAEAVYREFVYDRYARADAELEPLLRRMFRMDEPLESDGIYTTLTHVRDVLKTYTAYTEEPELPEDGADPLRAFLTGEQKGNAMLYATAAVEALRAYGIPARYVEGYYLSAAAIRRGGGEVSLTGQASHAWVEIYFDGVGWLPVDVTPGRYYDAVTLQQMVALPDTVHKTAVLGDEGGDTSAVTEDGSAGRDPILDPETVLRSTGLALLGVLVLAVLLATVLFLLLEILRVSAALRARTVYRRADPRRRVLLLHRRLFRLLSLWGIDACLGWDTDRLDAEIHRQFPGAAAGEYRRTAALMEKVIYGGVLPEPYEMRTMEALLEKVTAAAPGRRSLSLRLRLRYSRLPLSDRVFARADRIPVLRRAVR